MEDRSNLLMAHDHTGTLRVLALRSISLPMCVMHLDTYL
jgi:hypothetical protein